MVSSPQLRETSQSYWLDQILLERILIHFLEFGSYLRFKSDFNPLRTIVTKHFICKCSFLFYLRLLKINGTL